MPAAPAKVDGEAETFHLYVFSDAHVATDRAVSGAIRKGMGFVSAGRLSAETGADLAPSG